MLPHQSTLPALPTQPVALNTASGTVLTVGAGMEFATLHDALSAAIAGDVIGVEGGTYTNDFGTVTTPVSILAIGGVVNEVATIEPPNGKGLLTVDASLAIQGFTFTGGSDGSPDGNVAGIRYEAGDLAVRYCDFHDMQDGLLATPWVVGTGNVTIDHSEFAHNGTGDGYSHNLYVGPVASLSVANSYFHDAVVGHEIKSRAALTVIVNNIIADGPAGTASYDIDVPNAGIARIVGNVIEKGPLASNAAAIHYGGETQYSWGRNALTVAGNTILNDMPASIAVGVYNNSAANGLSVSANLIGNRLFGFDPGRVIYGGPGTQAGNTVLTTEPSYSRASPWTHPPATVLAPGPQVLNLFNSGHVITGGTAPLTINDAAGNNTVAGGSAGLTLTALAGNELVSTQASATDSVSVGGRYCYVTSAGRDQISLAGQYDGVTASGQATITSSQYDSFALSGPEVLDVSGGGGAWLSAGASVTAAVTQVDLAVTMAGGAWLSLADDRASTPNTATISGGATVLAGGGDIAVTTGGGGSILDGGSGALLVTGGVGNDSIIASTGLSKLALGGGADTVEFHGGIAQVAGGTGPESYVFVAGPQGGPGGSALISGFKQGTDSLAFQGFAGTAIAGGVASGGNTVLSLTDGTTLTLLGVVLPGYGAGDGGNGSANNGSANNGGGNNGGGNGGNDGGSTTLTTTGQSVTGGAALLTIIDQAGGNTIAGGTGGLAATIAALQDLVTTNAAATDQVVLSGQDTLVGAGTDTVQAAGRNNIVRESGTATVQLAASGNVLQGGAGLLRITDSGGGNLIQGGAGGLTISGTGTSDTVTTAAGAADTIAAGSYTLLNTAGNDVITVAGYYPSITASGRTSINSSAAAASFVLNGAESLAASGAAMVTVGAGASATVALGPSGQSSVMKAAGGSLALSQGLTDGSMARVTLTGGAAGLSSSGARYAGIEVTTSGAAGVAIHAQGGGSGGVAGPVNIASAGADTIWADGGQVAIRATGGSGVSVVAGAGNTTLYGGAGNDSFTAGAGSAQIVLGGGADSVTLGSGQITIAAGGGFDLFTAVAGAGPGTATITGWSTNDHLAFQGFTGNAIASQSVVGGSTLLALTDGAQITLVGITHFT